MSGKQLLPVVILTKLSYTKLMCIHQKAKTSNEPDAMKQSRAMLPFIVSIRDSFNIHVIYLSLLTALIWSGFGEARAYSWNT